METKDLGNFFGIDARIEDIMDDYCSTVETISDHFEISLEDANDLYYKHLEEVSKRMHDNTVKELRNGKFVERIIKD